MKRRQFMGLLGATALTGFSAESFEMKKYKKTGVQLYTLRNEIKENLEKTLGEVAKIGYKEVELFGYNGSFWGKTAKEFKEILRNLGLSAPSGHYLLGSKPEMEGSLLRGWEKALANAAEVGQKYVVCAYLFPEERTKIDDYKRYAELFNKSAEMAKNAGLQFCYHNHDFEFMVLDGQIPYDIILAETDKDLVKMELDLYWATKAGKDPVALFEQNAGRFPLWHVKDMDKTDRSFAEVGTGSIDFQRIFNHSKQAGLTHYFVEQDSCKLRKPLEAISLSFENLKNIKK